MVTYAAVPTRATQKNMSLEAKQAASACADALPCRSPVLAEKPILALKKILVLIAQANTLYQNA
jgi:hypothetical protein